MKRYHLYFKYAFLFAAGGLLYNVIEVLFRGYSHWTMFFLGGMCFVLLGRINEGISWKMQIWKQIFVGAGMITALEFLTGCIVNLCLGWNVWDYSQMPGNLLGQICLPYILIWFPVSFGGILLDDWLRYWLFGEEKPHYRWK